MMLTPKKHLNLDTSVLRVSAFMLREIRRRRVIEFQTLQQRIVKSVGSDAELMFLPALNLLYILGKVDYHSKNDSFEYKGS